MLTGYRLNIQNFFGESVSFDKIITPSFDHPEIKVSKDKPIAFILLNATAMTIISDEYEQQEIIPEKNIVNGFEFANFAINKKISLDYIKEHIKDNTIGWIQQFYTDGNIVLNIVHYLNNRTDFNDVTIEEIHYNPIVHSMSLVYSNTSKPYYGTESFNVFNEQSVIDEGFKFQRQVYVEGDSEMVSQPMDYDNVTNWDFFHYYTLLFNNKIINGYWLSEAQQIADYNAFKAKCHKPVLTDDNRVTYFDDYQDNTQSQYMKKYVTNFQYFYPTTINWCSNFDKDMVACSFYDHGDLFRVYFCGTDDCDREFLFEKSVFSEKEQFFDYMESFDNIVSDELMDKLETLTYNYLPEK
jgi:hypothetical protein